MIRATRKGPKIFQINGTQTTIAVTAQTSSISRKAVLSHMFLSSFCTLIRHRLSVNLIIKSGLQSYCSGI